MIIFSVAIRFEFEAHLYDAAGFAMPPPPTLHALLAIWTPKNRMIIDYLTLYGRCLSLRRVFGLFDLQYSGVDLEHSQRRQVA